MVKHSKFSIIYAPQTLLHLEAIEHKFYRLIRNTIKEQLSYTPDQSTRNRKPLELPAPFGSNWELRFGPQNQFRVFYEINELDFEVYILAIGIKERNRLTIGKEVFEP